MSSGNKNQSNEVGFDSRVKQGQRRSINPDGSFNIRRKNHILKDMHIYRWAITCSWKTYWLVVLAIYVVANLLFAGLYWLIGPEHIVGLNGTSGDKFWQCYFFSLQTFTTVGYGGLYPEGILANTLAGFEAFLGLMTFALATGALYGRFSKPEAKIKYARNAVIAPFREGRALMFMICNDKKGNLVEVSAKLTFSWVEKDDQGKNVRRFGSLPLDIEKIAFLSLTWTLVHPITPDSLVYQFSEEDFIQKDVEIFLFISCYDDTFSATVHSRYAYVGNEIVNDARFIRPFYIDEDGYTVLDVTKVGEYEKL